MSCIDYSLEKTDCNNINNNNQSDRQYASNSLLSRFRVVTRSPSSLKSTKTSLKPGALCPGGIGVDIKHNSYDRYLAKKKYPLKIKDKQRQQQAEALRFPTCGKFKEKL